MTDDIRDRMDDETEDIAGIHRPKPMFERLVLREHAVADLLADENAF